MLFDDDIELYSNILAKKGLELKIVNDKYERMIKAKEPVDEIVEYDDELLSWFTKQLEIECREKFNKYLNMKH